MKREYTADKGKIREGILRNLSTYKIKVCKILGTYSNKFSSLSRGFTESMEFVLVSYPVFHLIVKMPVKMFGTVGAYNW